ncbi:glycosyltransferase [Millionella massiliensis]|uniref:glycosyltransferase n=1 Tax=Millionella massiliensis TaxID=1871023 RepID=UPI0008D94E83|nr:glycosyltransferase [Millionella massiliensis]
MKILVLYNRDITMDDSGESRTIYNRLRYLADQPGMEIYVAFHCTPSIHPRIHEIPFTSVSTAEEVVAEKVHQLIVILGIDILSVPVGRWQSKLAREAVVGTTCKVITEFHTRPGYEMRGMWEVMKAQYKLGGAEQLKTAIKMIVWPLYWLHIRKLQRSNFRNAYLLADRFVLLSSAFFEPYRKWYKLPSTNKMRAIGNAVSWENEASAEEIIHKEKTILVVARFDERHKRISLILKMWKTLQFLHPDWNLQVVGFGPDEYLYRKLVQQWQLERVIFEGRQQNPEPFYTKAAIFVMTSAFEGWGMTLCEAMQKGCVPVVMDSFESVHDLISNGVNGYIVRNNDLKMFIQRVNQLITQPEVRIRMAYKGPESMRRFSRQAIGEQWVKLYNEVINS